MIVKGRSSSEESLKARLKGRSERSANSISNDKILTNIDVWNRLDVLGIAMALPVGSNMLQSLESAR